MGDDIKLGTKQVMFSPMKAEKLKITITKESADGTTTTEVPLDYIVEQVRGKYAELDPEEFFNEIEPFAMVATYVAARWGSEMYSPAHLYAFIKGFIIGRAFGKNALSVVLDRECVEEDEYRAFIAKGMKARAEELQKEASQVEDGDIPLNFLDISTFNNSDD